MLFISSFFLRLDHLQAAGMVFCVFPGELADETGQLWGGVDLLAHDARGTE